MVCGTTVDALNSVGSKVGHWIVSCPVCQKDFGTVEFGGLDNPLNSSFLCLSSFCAMVGCIVLLAGASAPGGSAVMMRFTLFKTNFFLSF